MSKKFTELNAGTIRAGSIFAQAQEPALSGDPYTSTKVSATQMANYVAKGQAFPELDNHTIIQALTGGSGAGTVILTMADYIALTPAEQTDGHIYVISDFACLFCYGRQYRAMQKLTQAEYDQLSSAEKNDGTLYIITDATTSIGDADDVDLTGLAAGNILRAVSDGQGGLIFKPFVFNISTSDNNKLLGVSASGSDISVGAVSEGTGIDITSNTVSLDINGLTSASTLDGTEKIAIYDGTGTKKTTAAEIAGLANAVTAGELTFESNFNNVASYIKKVGNVIYIHLDCYAITPINTRNHILTIPSDLYPNEVQRFICIGSQTHQGFLDSSCFGFLVNTNGTLFVGDGLQNAITDIFADLFYVIG